jgi:hypothetical protein
MVPKRVHLVPIVGLSFTSPKTVEEIYVTPDTFDGIKELAKKVVAEKGTFKLNTIFRSWDKQAALRQKYENYEKLSDAEKKKATFIPLAAPPGNSFHMAGRAIDVDVKNLNFFATPRDRWLAKFWSIAKPLGFRPIIDKPDLSISESWHFDFAGPWEAVRLKVGYGEAAKCAIIDVGNWNPNEKDDIIKKMFIQVQLIRLGHTQIGAVDGILGTKSIDAIKKLGINSNLPLENIILELNKK